MLFLNCYTLHDYTQNGVPFYIKLRLSLFFFNFSDKLSRCRQESGLDESLFDEAKQFLYIYYLICSILSIIRGSLWRIAIKCRSLGSTHNSNLILSISFLFFLREVFLMNSMCGIIIWIPSGGFGLICWILHEIPWIYVNH